MEQPTINDLVAEEIRVLLARRRMSASDLARSTGMTQRAISRRLTGEKVIDVEDLARIASALGVEVADLLPRPTPGRVVVTAGARPNAGSDALPVRPTRNRSSRKSQPNGGTRRSRNATPSPIAPTQRRPMPLSGPGQRIPA